MFNYNYITMLMRAHSIPWGQQERKHDAVSRQFRQVQAQAQVQARGMTSSPCVEEQRAQRPCTPRVERQSSSKYAGAAPKRHHTKAETRSAAGQGANAGHPAYNR